MKREIHYAINGRDTICGKARKQIVSRTDIGAATCPQCREEIKKIVSRWEPGERPGA